MIISAIMALSSSQLVQYHKDGYLVIPNFFSSSTADQLKAVADELIQLLDIENHPMTIFKTNQTKGNQTVHARDNSNISNRQNNMIEENDYFLDSSDKISYFFEEKSFNSSGELILPKERAINKIGHAVHSLDRAYNQFTTQDNIKQLAESLNFLQPIVLQSMIICKQPGIGGLVSKHRDSTFLYTEPSTAVGFWFALEDCTADNGCLAFVRGSHLDKASDRRLKRVGNTNLTVNNIGEIDEKTIPTAPNNVKGIKTEFIGTDKLEYSDEEFQQEPVSKGSLIIIHGDVVHASNENHSNKSRYIYTFHLIEAFNTKYPSTNWLQSKTPFTRLFDENHEKSLISKHYNA
jgi:phytanoyl-CoA hydroxylase